MPEFRRDTIVIGASAGGVAALRDLMASLPADIPASVLVVMHFPAGGTSALPRILHRSGPLPAVRARNGMSLEPGVVYVASPDRHLLATDRTIQLAAGPTESGHRPSINASMRSAALAAGPGAIGVVLSGSLHDGTEGLSAVVECGGTAVVQDPADALFPGMPQSALRAVPTAHVRHMAEMGDALDRLVREPVSLDVVPEPSSTVVLEDEIARNGRTTPDDEMAELGPLTGYTCPDCQGPLSELEPGSGRFRCQVGHGWSGAALLAARDTEIQRALWTSLRALDEKGRIASRLHQNLAGRPGEALGAQYGETARECREAAEVLRKFLTSMEERPTVEEPVVEDPVEDGV
jgi:two-component system chemotaxis response regulator CheB